MTRLLMSWILASSVLLPFGGTATRKTEEGNRHYLDQAYADALRSYTEAQIKAPQAGELYYNLGNVFYRQDDFERATEAYTRALLSASERLESSAAYNLGNANYRLEQFPEAVAAYERTLRENPNDRDAKRNLELALWALEQQQQEQQDQQQPGDEQPQQEGASPRQSGQAGEGEEGEENQEPAPVPGEMTPEEAERMLDGLEEQELENLRKQAQQQRPVRSKSVEKDW